MSPAALIVLVGILVASSCALVGSFLVLRKMSLMGDAISHSVLPGIAIAFFITQSRDALPMVMGAGALGVVTVFLVETFVKSRRMYEDTSIGVVFPALFSIGVILISRYATLIDLDLDCVLYGEIAYAPLDPVFWGDIPLTIAGTLVPKAVVSIGSVFLLDLAVILLFYKEFKITTFDPGLASSIGISPVGFHYLLMILTSLTVVAAFESVGAILVVAMLIVPAATAYLLCENLERMILTSVGLGIASAVLGYRFSHEYDFSIAGGMAVVAGALFLLVFLFSPRHGLAARWLRHRRLEKNMEARLVLLHLLAGPTRSGDIAERFHWAAARVRTLMRRMGREGLIQDVAGEFLLTDAGRRAIEAEESQGLAHR